MTSYSNHICDNIKFAHQKLKLHEVINLLIDLSLHSQLFRVYCYCIDLDHILTLVIVVIGGYYWPLQCLLFVFM